MCGIFGVVAGKGADYDGAFLRDALKILAKESQSRGKDSSGLALGNGGHDSIVQVLKGDVPLNTLLKSRQVSQCLTNKLQSYEADDTNSFVAMGHSRLVTNGTQVRDENNQPVIRDDIIGVHNGIIVNDDALWRQNPELTRAYEIDTEVLLALIHKHLLSGDSVPAAIARAESEIEGTLSVALLFPASRALALATNNGSLYTLADENSILFFASEQYPLQVLAGKMDIDLSKKFEIRQVTSWSGVMLHADGFHIERFGFSEALERAPDRPDNDGSEKSGFPIHVTSIPGQVAQRELVRNVNLIAKAPEAARYEAMLEFNQDRIARLQRCTKCLLPETFTFITFDAQGVCNYCRNYRIRNNPKPLQELHDLVRPYRRTDGKPDCIVPFSGGRDSTYALHMIKTELELNPIAFTYDWGMVTDLGRRNIARVCGKLGVENIIVAADIHRKRDNIRKNVLAWLNKPHLGMIPLFMAGDKYFYYYVDQVKRQTGIALNIWGINPMENTDFKVGFLGVAPDPGKKHIYSLSVQRQIKLFKGVAQAILSNPGYINNSVFDTAGSFLSRSVKRHTDYYHLYDYYRWDEHEIDRLLLDEYAWETAIDTKTTWRIGDGTAAFYNYIYYNVAGFSEHDTFRSNQIREGMITREEGLKLVNEENRPRYATIRWYTDVLNIDFERAIRVINSIPKLYP